MSDKKPAAEPEVSHNPALVEFTRDPWGMTTDLRKMGLRTASSIRGNKEKHDLFMSTLRTLALHANARFELDAEALVLHGQEIERAQNGMRQRVASRGVPVPDVVVQPVTPEDEAAYG